MIRHLAFAALLALPIRAEAAPVTMLEGARLVSERISDARRCDLPIGAFQDGMLSVENLEDLLEQRSWRIDSGALTTVRSVKVLSPLRAQLVADGYDSRLDCAAEICGGLDFRFANDVIPEPGMYVDLRDFKVVSAGTPR